METGLTFAQALTRMIGGHKIARKGWRWRAVELVAKGNKTDIMISDCDYKTAAPPPSKSQKWYATGADMLAQDWEIVE